MSSPNLDEDDLLLLNHATGNHSREECSWQDAHELLNSSVELLEVPGEYLKKTDSNNPRIESETNDNTKLNMRRSSGRARVTAPVRAKKPSLCEELSDKCKAQRRIIDLNMCLTC